MELRELRSLVALAESGSISETARVSHLTPAAIHKQLQQLGTELGVPVYERRAGKLRLTAAAEVILPYLRDIVGQHDSALAALEEWKGLRRGLLRIGSGPTLAVHVLAGVLNTFHQRYPRVDVDLLTGNSQQLLNGLSAGELDVIVVVAPDSAEEPSIRKLLELRFEIAVVSALPGVPKRARIASLARFPFLLFRRGTRIQDLIEPYLAANGFQPDVSMRFDNAEAMKRTLLSGVGVAMLPAYSVAAELRAGQLTRIRTREAPPVMKVHMLARQTRYTTPAVKAFSAVAEELLSSLK